MLIKFSSHYVDVRHISVAQEQSTADRDGVKRHYSTGDMLNVRDDMDTSSRRPLSEGFNQALYKAQHKKRFSFGVS